MYRTIRCIVDTYYLNDAAVVYDLINESKSTNRHTFLFGLYQSNNNNIYGIDQQQTPYAKGIIIFESENHSIDIDKVRELVKHHLAVIGNKQWTEIEVFSGD